MRFLKLALFIQIAFMLSGLQLANAACSTIATRGLIPQFAFLNLRLPSTLYNCAPALTAPRCVTIPTDPFDNGVAIFSGLDRGLCANTSDVRIPFVVSADDQFITVANFRHARRFWLAKIPKYGIEKVYLDTGVFKGPANLIGAGHAEIRFKMRSDSPIQLASQKSEIYYDHVEIFDFMSSSDPYNPMDGSYTHSKSDRTIGVATRLVSTTDRVYDQIARHDGYTRVDQTGFQFTAEQAQHLLETVIRHANHDGYTREYSLLKYNCVTVAFEILDEAFPPRTPAEPFVITLANAIGLNVVVAPIRRAIRARGLPVDATETSLDLEYQQGRGTLQTMIGTAETPEDARNIIDQYNRQH